MPNGLQTEAPPSPTPHLKETLPRWLRWLGAFVLLAMLTVLALVGVVWWVCRDLPDLSRVQNYQPWRSSRLLDRDGKTVALFADQRRTPIPYEQMPKHLIDAIVAAEDADFFRHSGLDYLGILRAFWKNIWRRRGMPKQGGSTITQQVVKTFLLSSHQIYSRKIREAVLARQLEQNLKKEEILYLYLNQIYFGNDCYGVEEAARFYFNKTTSQLSLHESAILAGIPKHPIRYNPAHSIPLTERRRRYVLKMLLRIRKIDQKTYDKTLQEKIIPPPPPEIKRFQEDYYTEAVRLLALRLLDKRLEKQISNPKRRQERARDLLYRGGLTLETPFDPLLQQDAYHAIQRHLPDATAQNRPHPASTQSSEKKPRPAPPKLPPSPPMPLPAPPHNAALLKPPPAPHDAPKPASLPQVAVVALEPHTRLVRALIGGRSFAASPFNRAIQAQRPPGSAFKPILYAAALESRRYTAATAIPDAFFAVYEDGKRWIPQNADQQYSNRPVRLREALARSLNTVAVRVIDAITPQRVIEMAQRLGIRSPLEPRLPLALGASAVQPLALTNAYATFAARGVYDEPILLQRISDHQGNTLYERLPNPQRALSASLAYLIDSLLQEVIQRGTAQAAASFKYTLAGKTGTTNQQRDAWFIGYTNRLCLGIWIGHDNQQPMPANHTGSKLALPLFLSIFQSTSIPPPFPTLSPPSDLRFRQIDAQSGDLAAPGQDALREIFLPGTEPTRIASPNRLSPEDFYQAP